MKKILIILLSIAAFVIIALFIVAKPYETIYERRSGIELVNVHTEYVNVTGDSNCTKLYAIGSVSNIVKGDAIFPATPESIPAPDDGDYAYAGNVFKLKGYPYEWVYRNSLTGDERKEKSKRFDVVSWEIIYPYAVWSKKIAADGSLLTEKRTIPLSYEFDGDVSQPVLFKMDNYIDCLTGQ